MILLTKEINERLKVEGLPELALKRTPEGILTFVGKECERTLLTISTMPVGKKLTVAERDILTNDYIEPTLTKHKKDITSLVALIKDTTIEDTLHVYKEEVKKVEGIKLAISTSYNHTSQEHLPYSYSVVTVEGSNVSYDVGKEQYSVTLQHIATTPMECKVIMKDASKLTEKLMRMLGKWKDMNEALQVKNKQVAMLQDTITVKCNL